MRTGALDCVVNQLTSLMGRDSGRRNKMEYVAFGTNWWGHDPHANSDLNARMNGGGHCYHTEKAWSAAQSSAVILFITRQLGASRRWIKRHGRSDVYAAAFDQHKSNHNPSIHCWFDAALDAFEIELTANICATHQCCDINQSTIGSIRKYNWV